MSDKILNSFLNILIDDSDLNKRLDQVISNKLSITRSRAQKMILEGLIKNSDNVIDKCSYRVKNEKLYAEVLENKSIEAIPQDIPLKVVFQDKDIAVICKDSNIVVHPAAGNRDKTLVNALLFHIKDLSGISGKVRPGIVHRLDKETSGLIVVAKNDKSHLSLAEQFKNRSVKKKYYALVDGIFTKKKGVIENFLSRDKLNRKKISQSSVGKLAITEYNLIQSYEKYKISLLDISIKTGRTHQIRVHLSSMGFPIVGDSLYGKRKKFNRHFLHCYFLSFKHPANEKEVFFSLDIPDDFKNIMRGNNIDGDRNE
jgi:23S rRNA pseudouridine1911/1915/1917 synthase